MRRSPSSRAALRKLAGDYDKKAENAETMADMAEESKNSTSYVMRNEAQRRRKRANTAKRLSEE